MAFKPIDLSAFPPERERGLKALYRYSRFELMYYRSNLWMHSWRMLWLVEALAPLAEKHLKGVDIEKARTLALVHDDAEVVFGDVQASARKYMSAEELTQSEKAEEGAIEQLSKEYPAEIHGYNYKDLLTSMLRKDTIESQFVSYVDKFDAYNESMHDFLAGNISMVESVMFYVQALAFFPSKFPALAEFMSDKTSPLMYLDDRTWRYHVAAAQYANLVPYTAESVRATTAFPFYDEWKRIVLESGGEEALHWLTEQKEYKMA
ncbi:MAG TPA: YfbR-like 5'-deoxynucleotidase [Candidatus Paceibacterota bacterium]|jgi:5'-deoxynucleotidase YfbR-like HD superfamily hydrolase|nr:YfbR-like 5'-deoxynucleotidase [Candidatus Paceibacterota bacterium]